MVKNQRFKSMIAIIDCGLSNLHSIAKAIEFVGGEVVVSQKRDDIERAEKIVLPGVGAFDKGMKNLKKLGLLKVLNKEVLKKGKPFLGICLGMQLLAKEGHENGKNKGLGWIDATVKILEAKNKRAEKLIVPHMGWDDVVLDLNVPLFKGLNKASDFYFVHSYCMDLKDKSLAVAECDYDGNFAAAILKKNIFAVQFHPEKSQKNGLIILKNFVNWKI